MEGNTILLVISVAGLSVSGWYLRGIVLNTPPPPAKVRKPYPVVESSEEDLVEQESRDVHPISYVTSDEHQLVLDRIAELERGGSNPKVEGTSSPDVATSSEAKPLPSGDSPEAEPLRENEDGTKDGLSVDNWKEIFRLQEEYRVQLENEKDTDYLREQVLFDLSQSLDGQSPGLSQEERADQLLLDNQLEEGESLEVYQERMGKFASLTKEVLIMRLEESDAKLKEQYEKHQQNLLEIIASLIKQIPGDVNLKAVAQASFVDASSEISNLEGEGNRNIFQSMFQKNFAPS